MVGDQGRACLPSRSSGSEVDTVDAAGLRYAMLIAVPAIAAVFVQVKLQELIVMEDAVEEGLLDLQSGGASVDQELRFRDG